jgi:hypothetical protein
VAGLLLALAYVLPRTSPDKSEQKSETSQVTDLQKKQDEFLTRINGGDRAALDEYREWLKLTYFSANLRLTKYEVDKSLTYWYESSWPYEGYAAGPRSGVLVIDGINVFLAVDLGMDALTPLGPTSDGKAFLFRKKISKEQKAGCLWDQSIFKIDISGKVTPLITNKRCNENDIESLIFHSEVPGRTVAFTLEAHELMTDLKTASGTWISFPNYVVDDMLEDEALKNYLMGKDQSKLSFRASEDWTSVTTATLILWPGEPRFDKKTTEYVSCRADWGELINTLKRGDKAFVGELERCMTVLEYPFKKFPIPGTDSYYGFMGNNEPSSQEDNVSDSVWCQMDGLPNGCMLYKVENGKPNLLAGPHEDRGENTNRSIALIEPLKANADGSLLVHHFPYEICLFSDYENYDFVTGTTTAKIIEYSEAGSCSDQTTITFYSNNRPIEVEVVDNSDSVGGHEYWSLVYGNKVLGEVSYAEVTKGDTSNLYIPTEQALRAYALQSDKTKFYFSVASSSYILDLAPEIPRLIER